MLPYTFFITDEEVLQSKKNNITKYSLSYILIRKRKMLINNFLLNRIYNNYRNKHKIVVTAEIGSYKKSIGTHYSLYYDTILSKKGQLYRRYYRKNNLKTASVHSIREIFQFQKKGKFDFFFLSPIFFTSSYIEKKPLNLLKTFRIINFFPLKKNNFICLGGMSLKNYKKVKKLDFYVRFQGFAGISFYA